jgi:hypothetical protein
VDLVLDFFPGRLLAVDDSSADRFFDLDDPEFDPEAVAGAVSEVGCPTPRCDRLEAAA